MNMNRRHRFNTTSPSAPLPSDRPDAMDALAAPQVPNAVTPSNVMPIVRRGARLCRVTGISVMYQGKRYEEGTDAAFPESEIESLPGVLVPVE